MESTVDFYSDMFRPFLPAESQVNPGRYGAELAYWLARQLAQRGIFTSYPQDEDWGWHIDYTTDDGDTYRLCCGNVDQTQDKWRCYLRPESRKFGRKAAHAEGAGPLMRALRDVLALEPGITEINWE